MHRSFKLNYVTFGTGRDEQPFTIASPVAARKPSASFLDTVCGWCMPSQQVLRCMNDCIWLFFFYLSILGYAVISKCRMPTIPKTLRASCSHPLITCRMYLWRSLAYYYHQVKRLQPCKMNFLPQTNKDDNRIIDKMKLSLSAVNVAKTFRKSLLCLSTAHKRTRPHSTSF